jgi:hypothetical protein
MLDASRELGVVAMRLLIKLVASREALSLVANATGFPSEKGMLATQWQNREQEPK